MKTIKKEQGQSGDDNLIVFRTQRKDVEQQLREQHQTILETVTIPTAVDLAGLNKPEGDCSDPEIYSGVITSQYKTMMLEPKTELLAEIEELQINLDAQEAKQKEKELQKELQTLENEHRLKEREFKKQDDANALEKKGKRFKDIRPFLFFMILVDMFLSSLSLEAMGYNKIIAYCIGLGIASGIYFLAENIGNIIAFGKNTMQKRIIGIGLFIGLSLFFYVLGIFRSLRFSGLEDTFAQGSRPIYFMLLNLFFVLVTCTVCYVMKLTKKERERLDKWKALKEELQQLADKVTAIKYEIATIREKQKVNELSRKQILLYAQDLQRLVQQLFEESFSTFKSQNMIHRSDKQVPAYFSQPAPKLPVFYNDFKL